MLGQASAQARALFAMPGTTSRRFRAAARCAARATASGADTTPRARPPGTLKTRLRSMSAALAKAVSTAPGKTVVTDTFCDLSSSCKALPKDLK